MMKQFTLTLNRQYHRPIVQLHEWNDFEALLDTGALFPVWTDSARVLEKTGAVSMNTEAEFNGFGGKAKGILYKIPSIVIGQLVFPCMPIIACKDLQNVPYQLILSATMFQGLMYEIDDKNHKLNITIPEGESNIRNLKVVDISGKMHILNNG